VEQLAAGRRAFLSGKAFGVNGGEFGEKQIILNGRVVGKLPVCGDAWAPFRIELDGPPAIENSIEIRHADSGDSYKISDLQISVELPDGEFAKTPASGALTSVADWSYREGEVFESGTGSGPVRLLFPTE
jgi:hypothetical protein